MSAPLTEHRRRRLQEAVLATRGALAALEQGTARGDAQALALAGAALQEAGHLASRYARHLEGIAPVEPARNLSPRGGPRRAA